METDKSSSAKAELSPSGGLKMRIRLEKSQSDTAVVPPSNEWVTETRGGGIGKLVFKRKQGGVTPSPEVVRNSVVARPSPGPCNILRLSFVPGVGDGTFSAQIKNFNSYEQVSAVEDTASGTEMSPACHLQPSPKDSGIDISSPPRDDGHLASVLLGSDSHDEIRSMPPSERVVNNCVETDCIQAADMLTCEHFSDRNNLFDVSHANSKSDSSKVQCTLRTKAERTADSVLHNTSTLMKTIGKPIIISRKLCGKKIDANGSPSWTVSTSKRKRKRTAIDESATYNLAVAPCDDSKTKPVKSVDRVVLRLKQREVGSDTNTNDIGGRSNLKKVKIEGNAGTKLRFKCYTRESSQVSKQQYFVEVAGAANLAADEPLLRPSLRGIKRPSKNQGNQLAYKSFDIKHVSSNLHGNEQLRDPAVAPTKQAVRRKTVEKIPQIIHPKSSTASPLHTRVDYPKKFPACDIKFKVSSDIDCMNNSSSSSGIDASDNGISCCIDNEYAVELAPSKESCSAMKTQDANGNMTPGLLRVDHYMADEPSAKMSITEDSCFKDSVIGESILPVSEVFHPSPIRINAMADSHTEAEEPYLQHCDPGGQSSIKGIDTDHNTYSETANVWFVQDLELNVNAGSATATPDSMQIHNLRTQITRENDSGAPEETNDANACLDPIFSGSNGILVPHSPHKVESSHHIQRNSPYDFNKEVFGSTSLDMKMLGSGPCTETRDEQADHENMIAAVQVPVALSVDTCIQLNIHQLSNSSNIDDNSQFDSVLSVEKNASSVTPARCATPMPSYVLPVSSLEKLPVADMQVKKTSYISEFSKFINTSSVDAVGSLSDSEPNESIELQETTIKLPHQQQEVKSLIYMKAGSGTKKTCRKVQSSKSHYRPSKHTCRRQTLLKNDGSSTKKSSSCVHCVKNGLTSSTIINVDRCMSGHRRLVALRSKVCEFIDAVFPAMEYPKGFQRTSLSVERFIDQILKILHSPNLNSVDHSLNCSEPFVEICCSLDQCASSLRLKILLLISALLPGVELPDTGDDEAVEILLEVLACANRPVSSSAHSSKCLSGEEILNMNQFTSLPLSLMSSLPGACISLGVSTLSEASSHCNGAQPSANLNSTLTPLLFESQAITTALVDKKSIKRQVKDCLMFLDLDLT